MGMNIGRGMDLRHGTSNADIMSVNQEKPKGDDQHVEKMREKIGADFTGDPRRNVGKKKNELGKDDFMKLMSAQLKYQDPISPMKNEQMAAQLAQFSALEQMMNLNTTVEKMAAAQKPSEHMISASLIGKRVTTDTTHFMYEKGMKPEIAFNLPNDAASVNVAIVDVKGEVVREIDLGDLQKGAQSVRWDGQNGKHQEQPLGEYSYRISAADKDGKAIPIQNDSSGIVSGVMFEGGKSILLVDGKKVPIERVGRIEADSPDAKTTAVRAGTEKAATDEAASAGEPAAPGAQPAAGAKTVTPKSAQATKQNSSTSTSPQVAKNNLPPDLSPEKIKSMLASMGAVPQGAEAAESDGDTEPKTVDPMWNPATN